VGERCRHRLREDHEGVRSWSGEILLNAMLKIAQRRGIDVELPLQVGAHLSFHLVDLPESKHALANDTPRLVGISVVADDLGGKHECGNK